MAYIPPWLREKNKILPVGSPVNAPVASPDAQGLGDTGDYRVSRPYGESAQKVWEQPREKPIWEQFQWGEKPEKLALYADRQKGESLAAYEKRKGLKPTPEHILWESGGEPQTFNIGDLPMAIQEAALKGSEAWGKATTYLGREQGQTYEQFKEDPRSTLFTIPGVNWRITQPGLMEILDPIIIFPMGKSTKGVRVLSDVVKLLEKGTAREIILEALTKTAKAGRKFELSEAENLIKTAEAKVAQLGKKGVGALPGEAEKAFKGAGGTVPPKVPPSVAQQVGNIPPGDTSFLEYLKNIVKPSRKIFEAGESAQRSRQAAAYKAAFEAAGGGEKGHLAGRAAQKGALKPSIEPFNAPQGWWDNHVNTMDQFQLVDGLGKPKPIGFDNATMKGAFLRLKQGVLPQPMELDFLEQYFGKGSMDALKKLIKPSWTEYPITWFYNSILSGPKTQIVNFGSNTLRGVLSPFESGMAAIIEAPLAFLQRRPRERFFGEAAQELFGLIRGLPEGSRAFVNTFISGKSLGKWELKGQVMKGNKWLPITWPTRLLEAADAFGFAIHSATSIRTQAFRIASAEKLKGQAFLTRLNQLVNNPTADMMAIAEKVADYRLFRQEPGTVIGKLIEVRNQVWPIRFIVPFLRTPANLVKYGLELSPLGILNPKLWKNIASKSPEAAEQIGRWVIGSGIAVSLGIYAADGNITGVAPVDPSKRDAFYRAGKQPFSLKIGDVWVSYQRLEPFNQVLSQIAAVVDSIQEGKTTKDAFEIAQGVISTIGSNLISQTYMENIANVMNFIEDPFGEGKRLIQRTASGFVPESALLRTIAQALDPTIRQAQNIPEQIMAGIPGLTEQIRAKTNVFGESQKSETPFYSPINISSEKNDPVNIELDNLGINIGLVGGTITFTNMSGKSEKVVLTGAELNEYRNLSGQTVKMALDKAVKSSAYRRLRTDEDKVKYLNKVISEARQTVREKQLKKMGKRVKTSSSSSTTYTPSWLKPPTLKLPKFKLK